MWYIMEKIFAGSCSTKYRFILPQHSNLRPCEIDFLYTGRARITYKHSTLDFLVNKWDLQVFLCPRIFSLLTNIFTYFLLGFSFILLILHSVKSIFMIVECLSSATRSVLYKQRFFFNSASVFLNVLMNWDLNVVSHLLMTERHYLTKAPYFVYLSYICDLLFQYHFHFCYN